jgi:serine/threonine-protein kinase
MAKGGLLRKDWFLVLVFSLLFIVGVVNEAGFVERLERVAYDFGVSSANRNPGAADRIVIVAIDDDSIRRIGRWPWPRSVLAEAIEKLQAARAKTIGLQVILSEPQTDPGLTYLQRLAALLGKSAQRGEAAIIFKQAEQALNTDRRLTGAIAAAGNVVLPMYFTTGKPLGRPEGSLPDSVQRNSLPQVRIPAGATPAIPANAVTPPLPAYSQAAAGVAHLNPLPDKDGAIRQDALVIDYYGEHYPSLALQLAARSLNLKPADVVPTLGEGVRLGNLDIRTGSNLDMYTSFYPQADGSAPFASYPFADVRDGKIPAAGFENKIVIIGGTAQGVGNIWVTPIRNNVTGPELTAHAVASILNQDFYTRPDWALFAEIGLFLLVALYLMFVLARMPVSMAALVSLGLLVALIVLSQYLLQREKVWLQTMAPALMLVIGHMLLTTRHYFATERTKVRVEADSAHTNRMLGLAFQNQGQLDMALDKFRALPVDDSVLDLIYNLALDFERKRQFNKAASAYDYILGHKPDFRDTAERRSRAQKVEGTIILGAGKAAAGGTLVLDQVDHKPTLGRYEVERELGKGAMGTVYFGRDPRINRVVAIKTMALSAEFEGTDLTQARERFFREAETAGRLSHPNIVTIFDAGEEHDLAYIAMEFLEGQDLTPYITPDKLLPAATVVDIVCKVAEALAYAHAQGVVHRDIKPANIMYDPARGAIKVTDFGIARVTASSRTRTGVVLGTPSYMSPEQVAGKHVDGRSDLFSLAVMTCQLLTGHLPFEGDSMATLMYQIANAPHPDILSLNMDLPECLRAVMDKGLAKDPAARYPDGNEFSQALRACLGGSRDNPNHAGNA